jgi:voltage-gated potassium channel
VPAVLFLFPDLTTVRAMRLLRLLRLLKLSRPTARSIGSRGLSCRSGQSFLIFLFRRRDPLPRGGRHLPFRARFAQPEAFGSIPASLWWALATLTTVGYGDVYPITTGGRIFTGLVLMVGIGIVAVPAGLITASLLNNRTGGATPPVFDGDLPNTQKTSNTEDKTP